MKILISNDDKKPNKIVLQVDKENSHGTQDVPIDFKICCK
jgi:hypothetical protein